MIAKSATTGNANAAAALILGAYLAIVLYQGNLGALATQAKMDFLGDAQHPAFWRWAIALLILYALAQNKATNFLFAPLLVMALAGMLIEMATTQPATFATLNSQIAAFFGKGTKTS